MKKEVTQVAIVVAGTAASALITYLIFKKVGGDIAQSAPVKAVAKVGSSLWDTVTWPFKNALSSAQKLVTGNIIDDFVNPGFPTAQFYLSQKYITADYRIDPVWRRSMEAANSGIAALFNKLLDDAGRIKPQYRTLINNAVHAGVL